jgi:anti-sigma B factor antagonist
MLITERGTSIVVVVDPENCAALGRAIEPWLSAGKRRIVLDFSAVGFINSVNIAQVVALRHRSQPAGIDVRVAGLRENIKAVFRILRLDKLFALDHSVESALG